VRAASPSHAAGAATRQPGAGAALAGAAQCPWSTSSNAASHAGP